MSDTIHIVCLDAPSPANYGGVFDLYYKIPALHRLGKKIILHYFNYKAGRSAAGLEPYCEAIHSYERTSFTGSLTSGLPYIVHSRINKELIQRLNLDNFPVIIEGIHCSGIIPYLNKNRKIVLRLPNDEATYYRNLSMSERNPLKKIYLSREAGLLEKYQQQLPQHTRIVCLSAFDAENFTLKYGFQDAHFIPCFIPWQQVNSKEGKGDYCLYHGNLDVSENREAVHWLISKVFRDLNLSLVIAGKGAEKMKEISGAAHVQLIDDPSDEDLHELISNAHIHVLPAFNRTGVKLKLLHALFEGRFCMANINGVIGSGLEETAITLEAEKDWITVIAGLMDLTFSDEMKKERQEMMMIYNNEVNALKLSELL